MQTTISLVAASTYLLMLVGYFLPRLRWLHIPTMAAIIAFDVSVPFYLYTHRDWWHRLIEQEDIFSFLVWMHFGLFIAMYTLDVLQVLTAKKLLQGDPEARQEHRSQGKALLFVRGLVILTGATLANPE
ncbi:MAG: hypothetical protein HY849_01220 [Nitrosomonadales bacterium]|nr:hypothetical protein [Nitrosomonadales bacterium]